MAMAADATAQTAAVEARYAGSSLLAMLRRTGVLALYRGLDLVKRVRHAKDSPNRFINVMMVTSFSEEHRVHLAMDAGINGYIAKPFTAGDFLRKFIHCMKDRRPFEVSESYSGPSRSAQLAGAGSSASA